MIKSEELCEEYNTETGKATNDYTILWRKLVRRDRFSYVSIH